MKKIFSSFRSFVLSFFRNYETSKLRTYETTKFFLGHIVYFFETALKGFRVDFRKTGIVLCLIVFFVASYGPIAQAADVETNKHYVDWIQCILRNKPQNLEEMEARVLETGLDPKEKYCLGDKTTAPGHPGKYTSNEAGWILQTTYEDIYGKPEEFIAHKVENILMGPEEENGETDLSSTEGNVLINDQLAFLEENESKAGEFNFENPPIVSLADSHKSSSLRYIIEYYTRSETGDVTDSYVYINDKEEEFYDLVTAKLNYGFYEKMLKFISLYTAKDVLWTEGCKESELRKHLYSIFNKNLHQVGGQLCYGDPFVQSGIHQPGILTQTEILEREKGSASLLSSIQGWMRTTDRLTSPLGEIIENKDAYPSEYVSTATSISNAGSRVVMDTLLTIELITSMNFGNWETDSGEAGESTKFSEEYFTKRDYYTTLRQNLLKDKGGLTALLARGDIVTFTDEATETDIAQYFKLLPTDIPLVGPPLPDLTCQAVLDSICQTGTDPESNIQYGAIRTETNQNPTYNLPKEIGKYFEYISQSNKVARETPDLKQIDPNFNYVEKLYYKSWDGSSNFHTTLEEGITNLSSFYKQEYLWPFFVYKDPISNNYSFSFLEAWNSFYGGDVKKSGELTAVPGFKDDEGIDGEPNVFEWTMHTLGSECNSQGINCKTYANQTKKINVFGEFGSFEPWYSRWNYADHELSNQEIGQQQYEQETEAPNVPWGKITSQEIQGYTLPIKYSKLNKAYEAAIRAQERFQAFYYGKNTEMNLEFIVGDRDVLGYKTILDTLENVTNAISKSLGYFTTDYISLLGTGYSSFDATASIDLSRYKDNSWWKSIKSNAGWVLGLAQHNLFCDISSTGFCTNFALKFKKDELEKMAEALQSYVSGEVTAIKSIQSGLENLTLEDLKNPEKVRTMEGLMVQALSRISNLEVSVFSFFTEIADVAQWVQTQRAIYLYLTIAIDAVLMFVTFGGWTAALEGKWGVSIARMANTLNNTILKPLRELRFLRVLGNVANVIVNPLGLLIHLRQIKLFLRPLEMLASVSGRLGRVNAKLAQVAGESSSLATKGILSRWGPIRNSFKKAYQWQQKYLLKLQQLALSRASKVHFRELGSAFQNGKLTVQEMETVAKEIKEYERLIAEGKTFAEIKAAGKIPKVVRNGAGIFEAAKDPLEISMHSQALKNILSRKDAAAYSSIFAADTVAQAEVSAAISADQAFQTALVEIMAGPGTSRLGRATSTALDGAGRQLAINTTRRNLHRELVKLNRELRNLTKAGANTATTEANILEVSNNIKNLSNIEQANLGLLNLSRTAALREVQQMSRETINEAQGVLNRFIRGGKSPVPFPDGVDDIALATDVQIQAMINAAGPRSTLGNRLSNYLNELKNLNNLNKAVLESYALIQAGKALLSVGGKLKGIFATVKSAFTAWRVISVVKTIFDVKRLIAFFGEDTLDPCTSELVDKEIPRDEKNSTGEPLVYDDYYASTMRNDLQEIYADAPPEWADSINTNLSWIRDINREYIPTVFSNFLILKEFSQLIFRNTDLEGEVSEWPLDKQTRLFNILKGNLMISLNNLSNRLFDFNVQGMCGNQGSTSSLIISKRIESINLAGITYFGGGKGSGNELSVKGIIQRGIRLFLLFISGLAIIAMIYGGILFTQSNGNDEKVKHATNIFKNATIGLFVAFVAFLIVAVVQAILYSI